MRVREKRKKGGGCKGVGLGRGRKTKREGGSVS